MIKTKTKEFLNPEILLKAVPLESGKVVADFGCGNGYYAVAAATLVGNKGQVYALDIMEDALAQTATLGKLVGVRNISALQCDLEKPGSCPLPGTSCDLVILASILHQVSNQDNLVREAYKVLKTGGQILVIEWNPDAIFGPPVNERISRFQAQKLLEKHGLRPIAELPAGAFHYALLYGK
ncbi:MAG: class I SAM-dependent methyltransferase [Candidatus Doudnabacteria bacterium]|nr:class I SAM-dependent methyltransferase [Candidatus Doudnabacteria bacterium]